jgi:hypothetical protein
MVRAALMAEPAKSARRSAVMLDVCPRTDLFAAKTKPVAIVDPVRAVASAMVTASAAAILCAQL